jgi:SRSO17 transposase
MPAAIVAADCSLTTCTLTPQDVEGLDQDLADYMAQFVSAFARKDQAVWAHRYLSGLLSQLPRKSIEPLALAHGFPIRAMQAFIADSPWSTQPLLQQHQRLVAQSLADDDAVLLIDESGFPKQGQHSAGVARQYCGALGKICSCQVGVFLGYASQNGYTLLNGKLFVPEHWFSEQMADLRKEVGLPPEVGFQTKPEIAIDLLQACRASGSLPARWVAADALYGNSPAFRDAVDELG